MVPETDIEWATHSVNFWIGCQKVGPGCDHCYAERFNKFTHGGANWGPGAPRRKTKGGVAKLRKIQRGAAKFRAERGHRPRVFINSWSDIFDNAVDPAWRFECLTECEAATGCDIMLLTKRVGNVEKMIPTDWIGGYMGQWPRHVGLMITVVNQEEANRDVPKLLALKAKLGIPWVGLSIEPMLGPVYLNMLSLGPGQYPGRRVVGDTYDALTGEKVMGKAKGYERIQGGPTVDWVICGGESGAKARPMHPDWVRSLRDHCAGADVPFLFKQWGEWVDARAAGIVEHGPVTSKNGDVKNWMRQRCRFIDGTSRVLTAHSLTDHATEPMFRIGKKKAGRVLDGATHDAFPHAMERAA